MMSVVIKAWNASEKRNFLASPSLRTQSGSATWTPLSFVSISLGISMLSRFGAGILLSMYSGWMRGST